MAEPTFTKTLVSIKEQYRIKKKKQNCTKKLACLMMTLFFCLTTQKQVK